MPKQKVPDFVKAAIVEQAVKGRVREPDLGKLVTHFFDICGGERAVATLLYGEFVAADNGSLVRQRILDMLFRCLAKLADKNPPDDDLGVLTEDDLEREILELADEVTDAQDPGQPAGPEAEAFKGYETPGPGEAGPGRVGADA